MTIVKDAYAKAGVDIDKGNEFVEQIKPFAKSTLRKGNFGGLGGFGGLFDLKACGFDDPILVAATDGVGTKLKIAIEYDKHDAIGQDLVAMCVNDLVVQGAEPLFFLDYYATSKLEIAVAKRVVKSIADACKESGCSLLGGETAEMPGMYKENDYDIAGFAVGAVERNAMLPKANIKAGDVLLGIDSSGFHSNGYSLVRKIIADSKMELNDDLLNKIIAPTNLYVKSCLDLMKNADVKAFAHITGGGLLENIPRVLPENTAVELDLDAWELPELFKLFKEKGDISTHDMLKTFNCGIGMVIVLERDQVENAKKIIENHNLNSHIIGEVLESKSNLTKYINDWK